MGNSSILGGDIPLGLGMALAQNADAMRYFGSLEPQRQQEIIERAKTVSSKKEMRSFVGALK